MVPGRGRRVVAALLALAMFGAAALFAWRAFAPLRNRVIARAEPTVAADPWGSVSEGWTQLPDPPQVRGGASLVWTGSELLLWGGYDEVSQAVSPEGFAYDPVVGAWSALPTAPIARMDADAVWTGSEALFWGGGDAGVDRADGIAFDPSAQAWRSIPAAPLPPGRGTVAVWTGSELIVFGGGEPGDPKNTGGAAYDPAADSWRRIADAPIGLNAASGVWDGTEMIVFGSLLNGNNVAATDHAVGGAYDPATDTWREIAPSTLSPQASSAVWLDGGMFAWDYETHGAWFDAGTDTWGDVRKLPFEPSECYPDTVTVGHVLFAFYCGEVATYDTITGYWNLVTGGLTDQTVDVNGRAYLLYRFASLAPAGDVVALAAEGITVSDGGPCYGCPGSPRSFWVYRPPSDVPTPSELAPPAFGPADGWTTISTSTDPSVADPQSCCATWAADVPFATEDLSKDSVDGALRWWTFPGATIRGLPPDGVVIVAEVDPTWMYRCCGHYAPSTVPLQLSNADVQLAWEGQIAPNVPLYLLDAYAAGRDVDIRVFFGTLHPSDETLSAAQAELDRLVIPPPVDDLRPLPGDRGRRPSRV